jgi:hypothetical protein
MPRHLLIESACALAVLLAACESPPTGQDSSVVDDAAVACAIVDGRGGADRFASLDAALAAGATRICLLEGDYPPPSEPITRTVSIEGSGEATRIDGTLACSTVSAPTSLEATTRRANQAAVVVGGGTVTIRDVVIRGCDIGMFVEGGGLVAERITARESTTVALAVGPLASLEVSNSRVSTRALFVGHGATFVGGVAALEGASLTLRDDTFDGGAGSIAVVALDTPRAHIESTRIVGGMGGLFLRGTRDAGEILVRDTAVSSLRRFAFEGVEAVAANVILGGTAQVERLELRDIDGYGLAVRDGAAVTVVDLDASEVVDHALIARAGSALRVEGGRWSGGGPAIGSDGGQVTVAGSLVVEGGLAAFASHAGGRIEMASGASLTVAGATVGAYAEAGGTVTLSGFTIRGAEVGLLADGEITASSGEIGGSEMGVVCDGGRLSLRDVRILEASRVAIRAEDCVLSIEGTDVIDSAEIWLGAGSHTLTDVNVSAARRTALLVDAEGALAMLRGEIRGGRGLGLEVSGGAWVVVDGTTFAANVGAAIALYGASAEVRRATFGGTLPDSSGRADEIRLVASGGTARTLTVESNTFLLDAPRVCGPGMCALIVGDGGSAQGIVRPNCLVATPGASSVHTVVDQNGASFSFEGDVGWSTLLAGSATNLGLAVGAAEVRPMLPEPPGAPPLPATF